MTDTLLQVRHILGQLSHQKDTMSTPHVVTYRSRWSTVTPGPVPDLRDYDLIAVSDSGGGDSRAALHVTAAAARRARVFDRVRTYHASLGPLEWPAAEFQGRRYLSTSEQAALHSLTYGVPPHSHTEVQRTIEHAAGEFVPYSLLTFVAQRGQWPAKGIAQYCTSDWKTTLIFAAWTPFVSEMRRRLGRPVRILNVLGILAEESPSRAERSPYRCVVTSTNGARHVDEWLPVHRWTKAQVRELSGERGLFHHWTYDSEPGARDWAGSSRCSCSICILANLRDLLLSARRRPRLANLYAVVEREIGHRFKSDRSLSEIIELSKAPSAPAPGIVLPDSGPDFAATERAVLDALKLARDSVAAGGTTPTGADAARESGCGSCLWSPNSKSV